MRTIGVVTVARSDYGIYLPVLRRICENKELQLHLIVAGMHLSPEFGLSVRLIEEDGFHIGDRVEMLVSSDTPEGIAKSMGLGTIGFAQSYSRVRPDILVILGDRFEMHAAVVAALPFKIPVAHIHGGELTEGAMDDALRHSITKMSHLHFPTTEPYAQRILQLGEEPWRVATSGAPSLDNLKTVEMLSEAQFKERFGVDFDSPPLLVTFHPVTLEYEQTQWHAEQLLEALRQLDIPVIFTSPNADTAGRLVAQMINEYVSRHPKSHIVANLGTQGYFSLMGLAAAMIGNSSSGIIEAASFKLPVVNIGTRQQGRIRAKNVVDSGYSADQILTGCRKVLDPDFRRSLNDLVNPYGRGVAAGVIVDRLATVSIDDKLILKRFQDSTAG